MSDLRGYGQLQARFRAVERAPEKMLQRTALLAVRYQKQLAPVRTGNLRRTIHLGRVTPREANTIASARYAAPVEFGTRPHDIRPRRRKVLKFSAGGRVVFTQHVRHPGTKAQPFMVPGAKRALKETGVDAIVQAWNGAA